MDLNPDKAAGQLAAALAAIGSVQQAHAIDVRVALAAGRRISPGTVYMADNELMHPATVTAKAWGEGGCQRLWLELTCSNATVMQMLRTALKNESQFIDACEMRQVDENTLHCTINGVDGPTAYLYSRLPSLHMPPDALVNSTDPVEVQQQGIGLVRIGGAIGRFNGLLAHHLTLTSKGLAVMADMPFPQTAEVDVKGELMHLTATPSDDFLAFRLAVACRRELFVDQLVCILQAAPYYATDFLMGTPDASKGAAGFTCSIGSNVLNELESYSHWQRAQQASS